VYLVCKKRQANEASSGKKKKKTPKKKRTPKKKKTPKKKEQASSSAPPATVVRSLTDFLDL